MRKAGNPANYPRGVTVPIWLRVFALVLGLLFASPLVVSGIAGLRGTLRRGGVRTAEAQRSEEAFRLANRVAGMPWLIGGAIAAVGGIFGLALPSVGAVLTVLVIAVVGALAIAAAGGLLGHRAAAAVSVPVATSSPCAGCLCGGGADGCSVLSGN